MNQEETYPNARQYIRSLAANGRYLFDSREARYAIGGSPDAVKLALNRLGRLKLLASPARGFYVVVPPEYSSLGCLPPSQFIPALMERLELPYYAGLLSAAQYHGAAHHRPQEFQVFLEKSRRPINCGSVKVAFFVRKHLRRVAVQDFNTARGEIKVSTPEATAVDLVGYERHAGGLDQVATVLAELAERIDPEMLAAAAGHAPLPWAQRLGYLLKLVGAGDKTVPLNAYVREYARQSALLSPSGPKLQSRRDPNWKLFINADLEPEL